jgi:hypothetical protein
MTELDAMLVWFARYENRRKSHTIEDLYKAVTERHENENALALDMAGITHTCMGKLMKDGYVEALDITFKGLSSEDFKLREEYRITFDGLLFLEEKGSYLEWKRYQTIRFAEEEGYRKRAETNAERLNILTAILGVGTIGLAVPEGIKLYLDGSVVIFITYLFLVLVLSVAAVSILYKRMGNFNTI